MKKIKYEKSDAGLYLTMCPKGGFTYVGDFGCTCCFPYHASIDMKKQVVTCGYEMNKDEILAEGD